MTLYSSKRQTDEGGSSTTVIAKGSKVEGELAGGTPVIVEGILEGNVRLDNEISIGKVGRVSGEISARKIWVAGRVRGRLQGREEIEIVAGGDVEGDLRAPRVAIEDGAYFKGTVEMGTETAAVSPEFVED